MSENPEPTLTSVGQQWAHELSDESMIQRVAALHEAYALLDPHVAEEVDPDEAVILACYIVTGRTMPEIEHEREMIRQEQRQSQEGLPSYLHLIEPSPTKEELEQSLRSDFAPPITRKP